MFACHDAEFSIAEHWQVPVHYIPMTTPTMPDNTIPDLYVGEHAGFPLVRINRIPETVTSGNELANVILSSMATLVPDFVHPDCQYN